MMLDENAKFAETAEDPACSSLHIEDAHLSSCPLHSSPTPEDIVVSAASVSSLATSLSATSACTCTATRAEEEDDPFPFQHTKGHHACGFFQTQKERDQLIIQFFRDGFARHEKMLYVHHYSTPDDIIRLVHDWLGVDLAPCIVAGDVSFCSTASLYKRNGVVDPWATIEQVRAMAEEARQQGYGRLRVTGEMCWVPACAHPIQELLAYESRLNGVFAEYDVWAMCQYNVNRWDPDQLINVLSVHPILMMGNEVFQNIYHMPPEEYLVEDLAANTLQHWMHNLEQRKKMESQLHERTLELLAINQTLQEEIKERQRMIDAKNAAEAVSKAKSEFMSVMSHEIRTPLNGIVVMTKLLGQTELSEEQREYVESIDVSGEHLLTMLNDVLDFSKIESGALSLENRPFETEACLKGVLSMFKWTAEMEDVPTIEHRISPDVPPVLMADVTRVRQILFNFLSNSVKFTPSGGRVWVHVCCVPSPTSPGEQEVQFEVGDTGIGIPEAKWPLIFNTFSQVDASITRKYGGTGLGLAISKRLVERMDGRIWFESREGQGSTFYFTVPVRIPTLSALLEVEHAGPAEAARRAGMVSPAPTSVSRRRADSDLLLSAPPPGTAVDGGGGGDHHVPSEADVGRLRILVAEDNIINQKVVRRILDKLGCTPDNVVVVDNGEKAVAAVAAAHFDIVFMDLQMPVMGGLDACRHILRLYWSGRAEARPAVIAMTAAASEEDKQQCMNAGMDGHVSKPIKIERVAHILQAVALACYSAASQSSSSPSSSSSFTVSSTSLAPSSPGITPEAEPSSSSLPTATTATPAQEALEQPSQAPVGQSAPTGPSSFSSSSSSSSSPISSSWSSSLGSSRCVDLPLLPHNHNQNQPHHPYCHHHHHHRHHHLHQHLHHASLGLHRAPTPADHCW